MLRFIYRTLIREKSKIGIGSIIIVFAPKQSSDIKYLRGSSTGKEVTFIDVDTLKLKQTTIKSHLFSKHSINNQFQLSEVSIPYQVSKSIAPIVQKIKRICFPVGLKLLSYLWIYDLGNKNFNKPFHLIETTFLIEEIEYPHSPKVSFLRKGIDGDFLKNVKRPQTYLKKENCLKEDIVKDLIINNIKINLS